MANEISAEQYAQTVFEDGGSLVVDLSGVEEQKFELIPKGIYSATVDQVDYQISKSSGSPMFQIIFAIDGGEFAGRKLFSYASFSPKALSGTKTMLNRIDPTLFNGPFKPQEVADSGALLGKPVRIKVSHEDYQGEPRARVQTVLSASADGAVSGAGGAFFG